MKIGELQGISGMNDRKKEIKEVAKEMEATFVMELLKSMRKNTGGGLAGESSEGETYTSMYDMELARTLSERGIGLQDMIVKGLTDREEKYSAAQEKTIKSINGAKIDQGGLDAGAFRDSGNLEVPLWADLTTHNTNKIKNITNSEKNAKVFPGTVR